MTGGTNAGTDANPTDLDVLEGNSITIDTSVFSSTFKESFKTDSLGTFSLAASVNDDPKMRTMMLSPLMQRPERSK